MPDDTLNLQTALAQAVIQSMKEETRKEIFAKALYQYLFRLDQYNRTESPITKAFQEALDEACRRLAAEVVQENRDKLVPLMQQTFDEALQSPELRSKFVERIVRSLQYP